MGNRHDKLAKAVQTYQESIEASGRMKAISANSSRIAEIEEKSYKLDLDIKEVKVDRKKVRVESIKADQAYDEAMAKLRQGIAKSITDNLDTLVEQGVQSAVGGNA